MAIPLRKQEEIEKIRKASRIVALVLEELKEFVRPGVSLKDIDKFGEERIKFYGGRPSFKGLYGFPASVCTSLNEVVIHGVPTEYKLKEGDIIGLDLGVEVDGWYGDGAITIGVGKISKEDEDLIKCAKDALYFAISKIKPGLRFKELSYILQTFIESRGYKPLLNYCGHGIGRKPHEEPEIPNYVLHGSIKSGPKIKNGMVFCIEPMVCQKSGEAVIDKVDKWSVRSKDNLRTSHWEHTIAVINGKAEILTKV